MHTRKMAPLLKDLSQPQLRAILEDYLGSILSDLSQCPKVHQGSRPSRSAACDFWFDGKVLRFYTGSRWKRVTAR